MCLDELGYFALRGDAGVRVEGLREVAVVQDFRIIPRIELRGYVVITGGNWEAKKKNRVYLGSGERVLSSWTERSRRDHKVCGNEEERFGEIDCLGVLSLVRSPCTC